MAGRFKELQKFVRQKGNQSKSILAKNLKRLKKVATGETINSLEVKNYISPTQFGFRLYTSSSIDFIDQGRKSGGKQPPPGSLTKWIQSKGIKGVNSRGRDIPIKSLEFLIGRSIAKNGIPGTNIISITFDPFTEDNEKQLETLYGNDIGDEFENELKKNNIKTK